MLRSMMHCVGRGIETGVAIACCTPTAGAGTPGTDRPANKDMLCELKSTSRTVMYFDIWYLKMSQCLTVWYYDSSSTFRKYCLPWILNQVQALLWPYKTKWPESSSLILYRGIASIYLACKGVTWLVVICDTHPVEIWTNTRTSCVLFALQRS